MDEPLFKDTGVSRAIKDMSPSHLSVKDVYERLCANRDREIELVWKRAVFLTAFLIACFTAYGGLLAAYIGSDCHKAAPFAVISVAAIGIGIVGMLLSIIWIQMAKGSKAWYEHYEKMIECFVKNHSSGDLDVFACGDYRVLWNNRSLVKEPVIRPGFIKIHNCLFSTKGGCFSVSKIVVVLGQIFFLIWMTLIILHSLYLLGHREALVFQMKRFFGTIFPETVCGWLIVGLVVLVATVAISYGSRYFHVHFASSGYLTDLATIQNSKIRKPH